MSNRAALDTSGEVARVNGAFFASLQEFSSVVAGSTPGYLKPWIDAIVQQPLVSGFATLLAVALL